MHEIYFNLHFTFYYTIFRCCFFSPLHHLSHHLHFILAVIFINWIFSHFVCFSLLASSLLFILFFVFSPFLIHDPSSQSFGWFCFPRIKNGFNCTSQSTNLIIEYSFSHPYFRWHHVNRYNKLNKIKSWNWKLSKTKPNENDIFAIKILLLWTFRKST